MQPTKAIWEASQDLLAQDAATLADILPMKVHLAKAAFMPSMELEVADLTEATFTGSAAKSAGAGNQPVYYDAADGLRTIRILEPAGGWSWTCTAAPASAETIYGVFMTDNTNTNLWGTMLLPEPITIDDAGQGITVGEITFKFLPTSPA